MQSKRNKNGNATFSDEDRKIGAKLASPEVDESWADRHLRKCLDEIHGTWSAGEMERRVCDGPQPVTIPQIITHHVSGAVCHRTMVE
jgi:hypothetical protein